MQMLAYGCTRLEVGLQSTYEDVARDTNRGHTVASVGGCFQLAKDAGFKVCPPPLTACLEPACSSSSCLSRPCSSFGGHGAGFRGVQALQGLALHAALLPPEGLPASAAAALQASALPCVGQQSHTAWMEHLLRKQAAQ